MANPVLKIKCVCRPTPGGQPRPTSNLLWLKRGPFAGHSIGTPPFGMKLRNAVETDQTTSGMWPSLVVTHTYTCTCQAPGFVEGDLLVDQAA